MKRPFLAVAAALAAVACGGPGTSNEGSEPESATVEFNLFAQPTFTGMFVKIEALRRRADSPDPVPADSKYPCQNSISPVCVSLDQVGALNQVFADLCPSTDLPISPWKFDFDVFSDSECSPESKLTGNNFDCYDTADLATLQEPNSSWEILAPGRNTNSIICITRNASEYVEFESCEDVSGEFDLANDLLRLDCGCTWDGAACGCPDGVSFPDSDGRCLFSEDGLCRVVCPYYRQ